MASKESNGDLVDAVKARNVAEVRVALKKGADPNMLCSWANVKASPILLLAVHSEDSEVVSALLESDSVQVDSLGDVPTTPLLGAIMLGNIDIVRLLLTGGADVNLPSGEYIETPVVGAARRGHADVCRLLLQHGASAEATDRNGVHSIFMAAEQGHRELVELLVDFGANPLQPVITKDGPLTASQIARQNRHQQLAGWMDQRFF